MKLFASLFATIISVGVSTVAVEAKPSAAPASWSEAIDPFPIAGPIYYVGTRGLGVYLIKSDAGLILLSGATPGTDGLIKASIRKLGFKLEDIRLLLISHAHFDHVGTLKALQQATGAKVAVMEGDMELLQSGGKTDYLYAQRPEFHFVGVTADRVLKDGDQVTLGDIQLTAHRTAGHTRGCTSWETNISVDGHTYSVVFADGTGINPGTRFLKQPSYLGIAEDYRNTFRLLESLQPDVFLSYHAEFFDLESKRRRAAKGGLTPWLDAAGYKQQIRKKRQDFEAAMDREQPAARKAPAATTVNCLDRPSWSDPSLAATVCPRVVDGLKAKHAEHAVINCLGPLEDGYTVGRCESVDVAEQLVLRDQALARLESQQGAYPAYFAGKDETCSDVDHKPKPTTIVRLKMNHLTEISQRLEGGVEAHCVVPGTTDKASYTASPARCQALARRLGQEVSIGVVGDHVCEVR